MATLVLAAAGAALGGATGGALLGVSAAVIGKTAGSIVGSIIDQAILGSGAKAVERGRAGSLRIQTSTEGASVERVYGRMRIAGQMIWATRYKEHVATSGGGKGSGPKVKEYSYTISLAIALTEGPIDRIGRVWADGKPFNLAEANWRLHKGDESQGPDPLIEAVEGDGQAPSYRGIAYIVFENLEVADFGNRIPQFNVEVFREPRMGDPDTPRLSELVQGVAMSPGTGEFAYETRAVRKIFGEGSAAYANVNTESGEPDVLSALDQLEEELPNCGLVSLVVSWFGSDLRCNLCEIRPGAENDKSATEPVVWKVANVTRSGAYLVSTDSEGRPNFGGTPSDASVIRLIQELKSRGFRVQFYPFILMDVPSGNGRVDPWTGSADQPAFPWRGRITTSLAPGIGSVDQTAAATAEVSSFFGAADAGDFAAFGDSIVYSGSSEWRYRRFVLHYAHLCKLAGGVDAFCIGSEMRSLTQIRSDSVSYPAVDQLIALAGDVRSVLGGATRVGYAADWSEYFGHQPSDGSGDVLFHLDPLWADANIDFIGIDYYQPLTDWREGRDHLDAEISPSIYDLDYLASRFRAGEGFDWWYAWGDRDAQVRTPISDGAHGEDWIYRPKDLIAWWSNSHHARPAGVREAAPTVWQPGSKPIWLTEIGCPAVDKGANQPNVFIDEKSSESALPYYSNGARDDFMQRRMLQAAYRHWGDAANNPISPVYGAPMLDLSNTAVWTWDARPWPDFPTRSSVWTDGINHERGHWLTGRVGAGALADVVAEICAEADLTEIDVSGLHGVVTGFMQEQTQTSREALQALMIAYGFDGYESDGKVRFVMRGAAVVETLERDGLVIAEHADESPFELTRGPASDALRDVRLTYVQAERDYLSGAVEVRSPSGGATGVQGSDLPIALSEAEALNIVERWAVESEVARDKSRFATPMSRLALEPGDVIRLSDGSGGEYRIERIEEGLDRKMQATRIDGALYDLGTRASPQPPPPDVNTPVQPAIRLMDLPIVLPGAADHQPYLAVWSDPWPGSIAIYNSDQDAAYSLIGVARAPSVAGLVLEDYTAAEPWRWDRGAGLRVRLFGGTLTGRDRESVLNGANLAALQSPSGEWEIIQFQSATLLGGTEYLLHDVLRGQSGTEPFIGDPTATNATFVLLNQAVYPIDLPDSVRGLERHYRIGPASLDNGDETYQHAVWTFNGNALRPYAPAHLTAVRESGGEIMLSWFRRSRLDIDAWNTAEPPLNEAQERYRVRIFTGTTLLREEEVATPSFIYSTAAQAADGAAGLLDFHVAQISDHYGPGLEGQVTFSD